MRNPVLVLIGLAGVGITTWLGLTWAPSVSSEAFDAPYAQRIFYLHVPSAWAAMISFAVLFAGSLMWWTKRSDLGWRMHVASSEAGLVTGSMATMSGCIWGAAEWGVPWDWTDPRLNTFALLTALAAFLVLARRGERDGEEQRDVFSTVGLFGFILVPVTYIATRIWEVRHPGPVVGTNEGSLDGDMGLVLAIGALSMTVVVVGHILHSMRLAQLEARLSTIQRHHDERGVMG